MSPEIPQYVYVLFIVFTAATTISVLIQVGILLGLFIGLRKMQGKFEAILNHTTEYALPLVASSKMMVEELGPKLKVIAANLADISEMLKHETSNIKGSVDEVLEKTRTQTARVDEMVSGTLDGISHASAAIQHGISVPMRQVVGIFQGFRAGLSVLRHNRTQVTWAETSTGAVVPEVVGVADEVVSSQ